MATEYELKFAADPAVFPQIRENLPGEETHYQMQTTYYDTPDRALAQRHITLRQRMENHRSVCTLKAPAKEGRLEFEISCQCIQDAIPELCKLFEGEDLRPLLEKGVQPVCGAKFHRITKPVVYKASTIELALDQGILLGGGKEQPLCEVECELKQGVYSDLREYAAMLALCYHLKQENRSKFQRAFALCLGE